MDVDSIEPGLDFSESIEEAVGACDAFGHVAGNDEDTATLEPFGHRRNLFRLRVGRSPSEITKSVGDGERGQRTGGALATPQLDRLPSKSDRLRGSDIGRT